MTLQALPRFDVGGQVVSEAVMGVSWGADHRGALQILMQCVLHGVHQGYLLSVLIRIYSVCSDRWRHFDAFQQRSQGASGRACSTDFAHAMTPGICWDAHISYPWPCALALVNPQLLLKCTAGMHKLGSRTKPGEVLKLR